VLVHGMSKEPVPSDWPPLTTTEVRRLLLDLHLDGAGEAEVEWRSPRPFSSAALVALPGGRLVVKRHGASVRSIVSLEAEHAFMRHLATQSVPVPAVRDDGRASAWQVGGSVYEVLQELPGQDLYADAPSWTPFASTDHAVAAGAALARLHLASQGYDAPPREVEPLYASGRVISSGDPLAAIVALADELAGLGDYLSRRPAYEQEISRALKPLQEQFLPHSGALGSLWAHNDWHPSNLLWSGPGEGEGVAGVIDFGLANLTSACYDLATALERSAVGWLEPIEGRPVHATLARAVLRGYWSGRPLQPTEAAALPHLLPIVHVEYALSEVAYFWRVVGSPKNADVAYDTYLLGHLRWFAGEDGRRLCSYLAKVTEELAVYPSPAGTGHAKADPRT
jgi:Ser/Thr protein kinase RdoA (MazF antagonist)